MSKWKFTYSFIKKEAERQLEEEGVINKKFISDLMIEKFDLNINSEHGRKIVSNYLNKEKKKQTSSKSKTSVQEFTVEEIQALLAKKTQQSDKRKFSTPGLHIVSGCWHVPFQNNEIVDGMLNLIDDLGDEIVGFHLIGDFMDLNTLSSHDRGKFTAIPGLDLEKEYDEGNIVLTAIDQALPNKVEKSYLYGNHEDRYLRYLSDMQNAKIPPRSPEKALKLKERGYNLQTNWSNDYITLGEHLDVFHGTYYNVHCAKKHMDVFRGSVMFAHCFSDDTEVLTMHGWKKFSDAYQNKDLVSTIKLNGTHEFQWNSIDSYHEYDHYEELIHFKSHGMDLMVTDEHAMIKWFKKTNRLERVEAHKLEGKHWQTLNGTVNPNQDIPLSDETIKLIGWVVTDGHYCKDRNGGSKYITIKQCNKEKVGLSHITEILDKLGQSYTVSKLSKSKNYECGNIYLNRSELTDKIIRLCPNKGLEWWMLTLSKRQFDLLLNEMILADGCYNKDAKSSMQYVTAKDQDKDIMQALCVQNGYRSSASYRKNSYWTITINTRKTSWIANSSSKRIPYEGKVACVSVKNGSLLVRRNEKTSICGNTHRIQTYIEGNTGSFNIGFLGVKDHRAFSYASRAMKNSWQNGFAVVTIDEKGNYYPTQIICNDNKFYYNGKLY